MKKITLLLILFLGLFLRLYRINTPLADWHSWRQADTAAVTRNFVKNGIDPFFPRFNDLSDVASGRDNPQGWRMVEFPVYNIIHAFLVKFLSFFNLIVWGRLLSIGFSLVSIWLLYLIVSKLISERVGLLAAFFMAVLLSPS